MNAYFENRAIRYGSIVLSAFIIGWIGWTIRSISMPLNVNSTSMTQVREFQNPPGLTNPLLYVDNAEQSKEYQNIHDDIQKYISKLLKGNSVDNVSVYFRDLNSAQWVGVNENDTYKPSSMLKVMTMMVYLNQADENPPILEKKLYYKPNPDAGQHYTPEHVLSTGEHTVDELMTSMIKYSDNDAAEVLTKSATEGYVDLFKVLRLPYPSSDSIVDFMSPKSYSILFRTLYSSSYLSYTHSEKALKLLTTTTFDKGLVAGVPQNTTVAHKFGEHTEFLPDLTVAWRELHDCGIVYYPSHPYLLCVMTKGKEFSSLETTISSISKLVYTDVESIIY